MLLEQVTGWCSSGTTDWGRATPLEPSYQAIFSRLYLIRRLTLSTPSSTVRAISLSAIFISFQHANNGFWPFENMELVFSFLFFSFSREVCHLLLVHRHKPCEVYFKHFITPFYSAKSGHMYITSCNWANS
jgi:hypothetical protein